MLFLVFFFNQLGGEPPSPPWEPKLHLNKYPVGDYSSVLLNPKPNINQRMSRGCGRWPVICEDQGHQQQVLAISQEESCTCFWVRKTVWSAPSSFHWTEWFITQPERSKANRKSTREVDVKMQFKNIHLQPIKWEYKRQHFNFDGKVIKQVFNHT